MIVYIEWLMVVNDWIRGLVLGLIIENDYYLLQKKKIIVMRCQVRMSPPVMYTPRSRISWSTLAHAASPEYSMPEQIPYVVCCQPGACRRKYTHQENAYLYDLGPKCRCHAEHDRFVCVGV